MSHKKENKIAATLKGVHQDEKPHDSLSRLNSLVDTSGYEVE